MKSGPERDHMLTELWTSGTLMRDMAKELDINLRTVDLDRRRLGLECRHLSRDITMTVRVDARLHEELKSLARRERMPIARLMRRALDEHITKHQEKPS